MVKMKLFQSCLLQLISIALCLLCATCNDNWDKQFLEIKAMVSQLESKISSVDAKLSSLNVLEYAFKTNTIDSNLHTLNTRVDRISTQVDAIKESLKNQVSSSDRMPNQDLMNVKLDNIKESLRNQMSNQDQMSIKIGTIQESLKNLPSPMCASQISQQTARSSAADDVVQKVDDYGKKLMQSHKNINATSQAHHDSMTEFVEVVKSGFSKVMAKFASLLALEGQLSTLTPLVRQLSLTSDHISSKVTDVVADVAEIKRSVTGCSNTSKTVTNTILDLKNSLSVPLSQLSQLTNSIKTEVSTVVLDISTMKKNVSDFAKANKAFSDIVDEVKNSISFPVSQLGEAMEDAKALELEMAQLNVVEEKLVKAVSLSGHLLAKESLSSLPPADKTMAQNLKKSLLEIENITVPLFLSVPYKFSNIKAIIGDSFTTMANRTQCRSDDTLKLEIQRLKESVSKSDTGGETNCKTDVFGYCSDSIQDMVVREKPDLKIPLQRLITHLRVLSDLNDKTQSSRGGSNPSLLTLVG